MREGEEVGLSLSGQEHRSHSSKVAQAKDILWGGSLRRRWPDTLLGGFRCWRPREKT